MTNETTTLTLVSDARRALGEAQTLPDIRRVMEAASVATDAGRRAAKLAEASGLAADVVRAANDAANDAAAVRIEAQAKAGEILRLMPKNEGGRPVGETGIRALPVLDEPKLKQGRCVCGFSGNIDGHRCPPDFEFEESEPGHDIGLGPAAIPNSGVPRLSDLGISKVQSSQWQHVANIPEPVRREYVETVQVTGGEVSTAGLVKFDLRRQAEEHDDLIEQVTRGDSEIAAARFRLAGSRVQHMVRRDMLPLSPTAFVRFYTRPELADLLEDIKDIRIWCDRLESAISNVHLEVIDGSLR